MEKGEYFANRSPEDIEGERLSLLESVLDPETIQRMETLGIGSGWCCLEIGAGRGSVVRWLAERVGPSGRVVAAALDLRFLERIHLSTVEIRHHALRETDFEPSAYDFVHCRAVLLHLPKPEEAPALRGQFVQEDGFWSRKGIMAGSGPSIPPILARQNLIAPPVPSWIALTHVASCKPTLRDRFQA